MKLFLNKTAHVKRATRNANNLSTYAEITQIKGYLRPLNENESSINGLQYGRGYSFTTPSVSDLKAGDKLVINSVEYNVQACADKGQAIGSLNYKKAILSLNI